MIKISAQVNNSGDVHQVALSTNDTQHEIVIAPKSNGFGSSANGGELLFLALATCYCNDIYREAAKRGITVLNVHVEVGGEFNEIAGSIAEGVNYKATVHAKASQEEILALMHHTDTVAEIQNTLRRGIPVTLTEINAIPV